MRFMLLVKADKNSEAGVMPPKELFAEMGKFNEEMAKAGVMLAGEGLHPTSKGARISYGRGKPTVTDGPFPGAKDLVAGFWLIQVKSKPGGNRLGFSRPLWRGRRGRDSPGLRGLGLPARALFCRGCRSRAGAARQAAAEGGQALESP
jgi:hypothetical protein